MSQVRVFTLLGDSNVRGYINKTSCRANPAIGSAQVLSCGHLGIFKETILKMRPESDVCILSCLTNFIASADGPDSISQRIDPVLQDICEALAEVCQSHPAKYFFLSPPMYRTTPVWYREGLPEVLTTFSQTMNQNKPANLHILSSFPTPDFQADGVHLTPYSGLEFLIHLFDGATDAIERLSQPPEVLQSRNTESTRVLEDRLMAVEQDHRRLNKIVESKIAIDAEAADFRENESNLDSFVISGLPLIQDLTGKPWQDRAVKDVQGFIKKLMGKSFPIVFVSNSTKRHKDAPVECTVRMREVADSKAIRDKFGGYFVGNQDKRPEAMKPYSVRNRVTPETKIRIHILQVLAKRYRAANQGAKVQVVGYDPRPRMKIIPPAGASDSRVKVYNFIEAVKALPTNFTESELDFLYKKISLRFIGRLRSLFICLSDDAFRKRNAKVLRSQPNRSQSSRSQSSRSQSSRAASPNPSNSAASPSDNEEAETTPESDTASNPEARDSRKRGASSPPENVGPPKK